MTNYDEGTQDEPVADTPAPVKRPTRVVIALNATFTGLMAGVLAWLVAGELEDPSTWGRVGILFYAVLTGAYLWSLVKLIRRRWAKEEPVGDPVAYMDRDGERWRVLADGTLWLADSPIGRSHSGIPMDIVASDWGPLVPVQD